uniref:Uncharacterized protein n=1 Tax=Oryza rufipogon TaxID=4529 RepID=A0A0E0MYB1_ORYRU
MARLAGAADGEAGGCRARSRGGHVAPIALTAGNGVGEVGGSRGQCVLVCGGGGLIVAPSVRPCPRGAPRFLLAGGSVSQG